MRYTKLISVTSKSGVIAEGTIQVEIYSGVSEDSDGKTLQVPARFFSVNAIHSGHRYFHTSFEIRKSHTPGILLDIALEAESKLRNYLLTIVNSNLEESIRIMIHNNSYIQDER